MAKISARNAEILIGGYQLSTRAASYEVDYSVESLEVTAFTEGWRNFIPGKFTGQMSLNMYWDAAANNVFAALKPLTRQCVTVIPEGWTLGNPALMMYAEQANFSPAADPDSVLMAGNIVFQTYGVDGGPLPGIVLQHGTITNTLTGTGFVDPSNDAVTARCVGCLHIWTPTTDDTYVIKIQDCATIDGAYDDLITFTANGTSRTSEWQAVASSSIAKYRRVLATRTGDGDTLGFTVSFWHSEFSE